MAIAEGNTLLPPQPKDNIDRAIKRALGNDGENYENVRYEGYGIAGVAWADRNGALLNETPVFRPLAG